MTQPEEIRAFIRPDKIILTSEHVELFYEKGVPDAPEPTDGSPVERSLLLTLPMWKELKTKLEGSWDDIPVEKQP